MPHPFTIRPAVPDDAEAYARCHVECLAETYEHIMPPSFAGSRRTPDGFAREVAERRAGLDEMASALAAGREPQRRHWVALDGDEVVGVVSSGDGVADWERTHFDNPAPAVSFNLDHLYTRRSTHGTGLGQALLDVALADPATGTGRDAWLWILFQNPRAEAFYRRNGFVPDGLEVTCGAAWFNRPMFRMVRRRP